MASNEIIIPFLKWAGGKRWLVQHPEFEFPDFEGTYIEPFLGSASVFFSVQPIRARARGAAVIVSNANHPSILKLYSGIGRLVKIDRASVISGKASGRKITSEVLIKL